MIEDWDAIPFSVPATRIPDDALNSPGFLYTGGLAGVQTPFPELGGISAPAGFGNTYEYWRNHFSADYDLDSGHTVTALISNAHSESWSVVDALFGRGTGGAARTEGFARATEDLSVEARISSPQEKRLRYTIGGTFYDQETILGNYGQQAITVQEGGNLGVFASVDFDITDTITFSGEGRLAEDEQEIIYQGAPGGADPNAVRNQTQSFTKFMPRVILSYNPTADLNIYGSWSNSFLPGVPTNAVAYGLANPTSGISETTVGLFTDVQKLNAFEIGIKQNLTDRISYNAALYNMDWDNQVFFQLNNFFQSVFLPGDSKYLGAEFSADFEATDWLTLSGSLNYVKAEFTDFGASGTLGFRRLNPFISPGEQIDATGNRPRYIPQTEGTFSVDIDLERLTGIDAFARADAIYTGNFFIDNLEYNKVSGYTKFNARVGFNVNDAVGIEIFGKNLTDDQSWGTSGGTTGFFSRNTFGGPTEGRELGVKVSADF